ncbi:hypothetical protein C8R32_106199 [Nitrosospira sp. Nsp5]|uniref:Uncharacterized protein n=1 Tax=Nitrosospira multiformis TaxID=1231 RepID=A0ABY0T9M5_9PROT|nr:hypothetical protein C8R32_106199 [Nitrosospira sp. Nsp5]SDQ49464.1 hypothetical protein SAMN05216402_1073 [Nitrosospira multiformis]
MLATHNRDLKPEEIEKALKPPWLLVKTKGRFCLSALLKTTSAKSSKAATSSIHAR